MMRGVDGFRMDAVHFVYEREDLADEPKSNIEECSSTDFCWLDVNHPSVMNQPEDHEIVLIWRQFLDEFSKSENKSM